MDKPVTTDPTCRNKRRALGLAYPKSSCDQCGSVIRSGWRCAEENVQTTKDEELAEADVWKTIYDLCARAEGASAYSMFDQFVAKKMRQAEFNERRRIAELVLKESPDVA